MHKSYTTFRYALLEDQFMISKTSWNASLEPADHLHTTKFFNITFSKNSTSFARSPKSELLI